MLGRVSIVIAAALAVLGSQGPGRAQVPAQVVSETPPADSVHFPDPYLVQDRNGPLLQRHPLLDPPSTPPGWFAALEVDLVGPAIKQRVKGQVTLGEDLVDVQLPDADLNWTGAPQLEVGYRFPEAVGELVVSYRLLAAEGRGSIPGFDAAGDGALKSRLDAHVLFLDYTSREFSLWPYWDMKAHVGVCVPSIFFDSQAEGATHNERVSSYYFGAGPHLGFDFWGRSPIPGLGLYGRLNGALTVGKVHQQFAESLLLPDSAPVAGSSSLRKVRETPMVSVDTGLSYTLPGDRWQLRLATGYLFERWFYLAQTDDSRGELTVQGLFLRVEWGF